MADIDSVTLALLVDEVGSLESFVLAYISTLRECNTISGHFIQRLASADWDDTCDIMPAATLGVNESSQTEHPHASHPDDAYLPLVHPKVPMSISFMHTAEVVSYAQVSKHW